MRKLLLVSIVLLALAGIGAASAAPNLVRNGGFELPPLGTDVGFVECPDGVVQDWDIGGAGIDHIRTYWAPSEGSHSIDLSRRGGGSVSQLVPTDLGGSYTLSFDMAGNPECGPEEKLLMVSWGDEPAFGPYSYITTGYPTVGPGGWQTVTLADLPGKAVGNSADVRGCFNALVCMRGGAGQYCCENCGNPHGSGTGAGIPVHRASGGIYRRAHWGGVLYQVYP